MQEFTKVMKALSVPNRGKMLKLLQRQVLCVGELQELLGLAQSTVSKHLKVLEGAGLVVAFREGPWVDYRLANDGSSPYVSSLLASLRHWLEDDAEVKELLISLSAFR